MYFTTISAIFTQGDYFRFIINSKFADAIKRFMTSNVDHDELIEKICANCPLGKL